MADILLWAIAGLVAVACALLAMLLARLSSKGQEALQSGLREDLRAAREESNRAARDLREEITKNLQGMAQGMTTQSQNFVETNQVTIDRLRNTIDERLKGLQEGNERKLDEMRKTVDEKLHDTLEKRLGESFKLVSQHLEAVQRGLGEMKSLADGVGDLKKVLTNVKTRGTWGEVQLGAILEQVMNEDQYAKNVQTKDGSGEIV
ncbi:MAG: DNA recombination protein RmuC, partial [Deltaproteobacteria bacterium]|nr:DNA recombination protein RmuC [Deltaproteobacteria bacterium]